MEVSGNHGIADPMYYVVLAVQLRVALLMGQHSDVPVTQ